MLKHRPFIVIVVLLILGWANAYAQKNVGNLFVRNTYKGDEMFLNLYYDQAITYYKLALKKDKGNTSLKLKLAESHRLKSDYKSALFWYDQVFIDHPEEGTPIDKYHYANVLLTAGRYDDAASWYESYKLDVPEDLRPDKKLEGINNLTYFFRDSIARSISSLPFNTAYDELAASKYKHGFVFLSSRESSSFVDQDYLREKNLLEIYYVAYDSSSGWQTPQIFDKAINTAYHEGPLAFYHSDEKLILTRSNIHDKLPRKSKDGKTKLQLFTVSKEGGKWSHAEPLSFNNQEYSFAHPTLSLDNDTLYFSSDMDGGFGGNDLFMSVYKSNHWSEPVNLGTTINTEGDEMYPFFINKRLFFSSNGHAGLGGLDIFKAFMDHGKPVRITNVGYPLNSSQDDFAYTVDLPSMSGTFTSNRPGGAGEDDIYQFKYEDQVLNGLIAQIQDGSPIPDALIELFQDGQVITTTTSDANGRFHLLLPLSADFELRISKEDHEIPQPIKISSRLPSIDLDTVRIALRMYDLFAQGRVLNNETQQLMPDVRVIIRNVTDNEFDTLITDASGIYRFVLTPMKEYSIWAGKSGFLVRGVDINTMRINKGVILNDIVLELEYAKKNDVHFEFDKSNLTREARAILSRVAQALKNTPNRLVISAYADARGTKAYNQELSDKRAASVLDYFISQDFPSSRITARGFGETLILNRCTDGVDCEEIEHSQNRRAEIKIEGSTVR